MKKRGPRRKSGISDPAIVQLGKRIRDLRKAAGYSSHETFAYEHNIARAQYLAYEHGRDLQFSNLLRIVRAHRMSLADFFAEGFEEE
ncbi:MAG: helix-turn-helix transcriptional regulator [Bacteroidetes bacterium]|nr:helix-turn-helix transcriptional regulator [Bacteroidota bacterium]